MSACQNGAVYRHLSQKQRTLSYNLLPMKSKNKKAKATKPKTFKEAVEATPDIAKCYQSGLQGLGKYSNKVELTDNRQCSGSIPSRIPQPLHQ